MSGTEQRTSEYVVAADLGGTNLLCAVVDRDFTIIKRTSRPSHANLARDPIIRNIEEAINEIMGLIGQETGDLAGIGIGAPGIVYADKGIIHCAANFPHWQDVPLAGVLRDKFGVPVFVRHDIDLVTLAEKYHGAGRGKEHVVCLTIGTGIGAGMILNGQLYCGANAGAGNLGHMIIDRNLCSGGGEKHGILETLAAGPAIRAKAIESVTRGNRTELTDSCKGNPEGIDARMVFEAARDGDEVSLNIVKEIACDMGIGIANVINLLSPEVVIVGGGVSLAGDVLFTPLIVSVKEHVCNFSGEEVNIVPAQLGEDAGLIGAAHIVWNANA